MSKWAQIDTLAVMIIDGKKIAADITAKLKAMPKPKKYLAAVLVDSAGSPRVGATDLSDMSASESFLKIKEKTAQELGVDFRLYKFPADIKNDDLRKKVRKIALHKTCGGVIVQLPLPEHINAQYIFNVIPPEKDMDVLGERAIGAFYAGRNPILPPAAGVVDSLLSTFTCLPIGMDFQLSTSAVAVVGLGQLVGKPVAVWLMRKAQDLHLLHRGSDFSVLKQADLIITGTGVPGLIKPEMLKDGAGVIDFGYAAPQAPPRIDAEQTRINAESRAGESHSAVPTGRQANSQPRIRGDFDAERLAISDKRLAFYTPTPGGTGPILVAKLFENFYQLNQSR